MTSREVRRRARAEHESIRQRLASLETLVSRVLGGEAGGVVQALEEDLVALRTELGAHLTWEDVELPRPRGADRRGETDASYLHSIHDELRTVLDFCHHSCGDENHPVVLAQRAHDLADLLRRTIDAEEKCASESTAGRHHVATTGRPSS